MIEAVDELNVPIAGLARLISGVDTVILANQGKAPPTGLYGTYSITPVRAYGHPRQETADIDAVEPIPDFEWTDFQITTITAINFTVSLNFFNDGAKTAAMRFLNANFRPSVSDYLFAHSMGWRYTSEVRNLTNLDSATLQQRAQLDLHLWAQTKMTDVVLRAAGVNVEVVDENGNKLAGA